MFIFVCVCIGVCMCVYLCVCGAKVIYCILEAIIFSKVFSTFPQFHQAIPKLLNEVRP